LFSGFFGGLKSKKLKDKLVRNPEFVLRHAVMEMLDDVKFRKKLMSRLKVVKGTEHTYAIAKKLA
jgi:large subunit ribosomal protein L13